MNKFRNLMKPKVLVSGLLLAATLALGWGVIGNNSAHAGNDCDNNAIIKCGYTSPSDLVNHYKKNVKGDLDNIYNHYGLQSSELSRFQSTAQKATVYKDGRVVLADGTVIATGAHSVGRQNIGANRHSTSIDKATYYHSATKDSFASGSLAAYVMVNPDTHAMEFAALTACGNPVYGTSPEYKCNNITKTAVSGTKDTFDFSASTYAKHASLNKLVYDFGDGQTKTVTSNFGQKIRHTYKPGKFTAKVTAYFNVNGKIKSDTRAQCATPVEVPQPPKPVFACANIQMVVKNKDEREYTFTVTANYANGPVLASADFNFGDGQSQNGVVSANKKSASVTHKYAKNLEGDIKIKATVKTNTGLTATAAACETKLTFKKDVVYCKPGIPVGDERCTDYCKPGIPVGDEKCEEVPLVIPETPTTPETPAELPSTGPAEILVGTMGMGSLVGAASYYRNSRRNLKNSFFNKER